jgi:electron transfer flavoprotein alpha/beta subunit
MAAKKIAIVAKNIGDLGLSAGQVGAAGALVEESGLELPPPRPSGKIIQGATPEAKVKELVRLLRDEAKVI